MRRDHWLRFDPLEAKKLLSTVHVATVASDPVVLDGTLAVDMNAASTTQNADGSTTSSVPIAGRLGTLGKFRGVWEESVDSFGDYMGPDTLDLQLGKSKNSIIISFNNPNENTGQDHPIGHGIGYYQHAQRLTGGTGNFANASENGSIEVMVNTAKKTVQGIELISTNT